MIPKLSLSTTVHVFDFVIISTLLTVIKDRVTKNFSRFRVDEMNDSENHTLQIVDICEGAKRVGLIRLVRTNDSFCTLHIDLADTILIPHVFTKDDHGTRNEFTSNQVLRDLLEESCFDRSDSSWIYDGPENKTFNMHLNDKEELRDFYLNVLGEDKYIEYLLNEDKHNLCKTLFNAICTEDVDLGWERSGMCDSISFENEDLWLQELIYGMSVENVLSLLETRYSGIAGALKDAHKVFNQESASSRVNHRYAQIQTLFVFKHNPAINQLFDMYIQRSIIEKIK